MHASAAGRVASLRMRARTGRTMPALAATEEPAAAVAGIDASCFPLPRNRSSPSEAAPCASIESSTPTFWNARRLGALTVMPAPYTRHSGSSFDEVDLDAALAQLDRRAHPGDAAADDQCASHYAQASSPADAARST